MTALIVVSMITTVWTTPCFAATEGMSVYCSAPERSNHYGTYTVPKGGNTEADSNGHWVQDEKGKWWQNPDGTWVWNSFVAIDDDHDGIGYWYNFDWNGYLITNVTDLGNPDYRDEYGRAYGYPDANGEYHLDMLATEDMVAEAKKQAVLNDPNATREEQLIAMGYQWCPRDKYWEYGTDIVNFTDDFHKQKDTVAALFGYFKANQ